MGLWSTGNCGGGRKEKEGRGRKEGKAERGFRRKERKEEQAEGEGRKSTKGRNKKRKERRKVNQEERTGEGRKSINGSCADMQAIWLPAVPATLEPCSFNSVTHRGEKPVHTAMHKKLSNNDSVLGNKQVHNRRDREREVNVDQLYT